MKRAGFLLALPLSACATPLAADADYRPMPIPADVFAVPEDVFASAIAEFRARPGGERSTHLAVGEEGEGRKFVMLSRHGPVSDLVVADDRRAVLAPTDGGWRVIALGERWLCRRGRGSRAWTTERCR